MKSFFVSPFYWLGLQPVHAMNINEDWMCGDIIAHTDLYTFSKPEKMTNQRWEDWQMGCVCVCVDKWGTEQNTL